MIRGIIYKYTSPSGKVYIGQTINEKDRRKHFLIQKLSYGGIKIDTEPFKVETGLLGQLEIGAGKIKMDIPMVNKSLVLNQQDLNELKDMLSH